MSNAALLAFSALPERLYILEGGAVAYAGGAPEPLNVAPSRALRGADDAPPQALSAVRPLGERRPHSRRQVAVV